MLFLGLGGFFMFVLRYATSMGPISNTADLSCYIYIFRYINAVSSQTPWFNFFPNILAVFVHAGLIPINVIPQSKVVFIIRLCRTKLATFLTSHLLAYRVRR